MSAVNALGLCQVQTVASVVGPTVTAMAVLVGGGWAYYKFLRGRTYRPRLSVNMLARWQPANGRQLLHARITVKNIGVSVVTLRQEGTGLRVSLLSPRQPDPPAPVEWNVVRVFEILKEHEWIEAGETVSDDLLLDIDVDDPTMLLCEARLVWSWSGHAKEIVVRAREVFAPDTTFGSASTAASEGAQEKEKSGVR